MMADGSPHFRFYPRDFLASVMEWEAAEVGHYIRLLSYQWDHGSIPADPRDWDRISPGASSFTGRLRSKFIVCSDGRARNPRLELERDKLAEFIEAQKKKGILSAQARTRKRLLNRGLNPVANPVPTGGSTKRSTEVSTETQPSGMPECLNACMPECQNQNPPNPPTGGAPVAQSSDAAISLNGTHRKRSAKADCSPAYDAYPRKVAKLAALRAIEKAAATIRDTQSVSESDAIAILAERSAAYARLVKRQAVETKFIPHAATWFNAGQWDDPDVISETERGKAAASRPTQSGPLGWTIDRGPARPVVRFFVRDGATLESVIEKAKADSHALTVDTFGLVTNETKWRR